MSKRKRDSVDAPEVVSEHSIKRIGDLRVPPRRSINIQVVAGSYDKVLHGIHASVPPQTTVPTPSDPTSEDSKAIFTDTFLFNAHSSAVRCLSVSGPSETNKVILASGSSDGLINLYSLSTISPPAQERGSGIPTHSLANLTEAPRNKELGSLTTHTSSISALSFPTRSKLLSASTDNTVAVTRTRDWTSISTIKAPIPKPVGRPSGDTAAAGEVPAGINDFAVHPSMKLMLSVGKGEKCLRLWNLVTGKKAGVLNFGKEMLQAVGEGRYATGEGRRVLWRPDGEEFVAGFERGAVVFGLDCKPRGRIVPVPGTKICQMRYLPPGNISARQVLAVSTEDGRILFFDTRPPSTLPTPPDSPSAASSEMPTCMSVGTLGGRAAGINSRIKDFEILKIDSPQGPTNLLMITGCSDGTIRIWSLDALQHSSQPETLEEVGKMLGMYETGNRITCLTAFVMTDAVAPDEKDDAEEGEAWEGLSPQEGSSSDSEENE